MGENSSSDTSDTEQNDDVTYACGLFARGPSRGGSVLGVPMPEGKSDDIRHWILPPTDLFWTNRRHHRLHVRSWMPAAAAIRGTVFWMHGYAGHVNSKHTVRYPQVLCDSGYAVLAFECEGHGYSPGERCFIRSFDDVLDDAVDFISLVLGTGGPPSSRRHRLLAEADGPQQLDAMRRGRFVVFGESMGGAIALHTALRIQEGDLDDAVTAEFAGAVVCAPALAVSLPPVVVQVLLRNLVVPLVPSLPMPSAVSKNATIDKALMLRDPELIKMVEMDEWGEAKGALGWHKPMKWATAGAFSKLYSALEENMQSMAFPFLVLHDPGDQICKIDGAHRLMELSPSADKQLIEVPNGLHDLIVNEQDVVHKHVIAFLQSHL